MTPIETETPIVDEPTANVVTSRRNPDQPTTPPTFLSKIHNWTKTAVALCAAGFISLTACEPSPAEKEQQRQQEKIDAQNSIMKISDNIWRYNCIGFNILGWDRENVRKEGYQSNKSMAFTLFLEQHPDLEITTITPEYHSDGHSNPPISYLIITKKKTVGCENK